MTAPTQTIQAVVVLYRCSPQQSDSLRGLLAAAAELPVQLSVQLRILIYDNSPQPADSLPEGNLTYVHDPANGGLLAAYLRALAEAQRNRADWLLLLDHDTRIQPEFLRQQAQFAASNPDATLAASVPHLRSGGLVRSPHGPVGTSQRPLPQAFQGTAPLGTTAFNSGAMLRVAALDAVGGFPLGYRLDFLDHALFARLASQGFRLHVLPLTLDHPMTWEDPAREMSIERFTGVLESELRFHKEFGTLPGALLFRLRCLHRAVQYSGWPNKQYSKVCWRIARS